MDIMGTQKIAIRAMVVTSLLILGQEAMAQLPGKPSLGSGEPLSASVKQQIALVLKDKATWSPSQKKMSSDLIYAMRTAHGQPAVAGVPVLRDHLQRDILGRVLIDVRGQITPGLVQAVSGMGGKVVSSLPSYSALRVWLPVDWLSTLAQRTDVRNIKSAARAKTHSGSVTSEGDIAHGSDLAKTYGATGLGHKIGVLSDSVDNLASSVSTGDLPNNVNVLLDLPGQTGEGTAMLEIIHDLAPDATLAFASAFISKPQFAKSILDLASAGCDIIVDDVFYNDEYAFQDDVVASSVDQVVANGAVYFSAAGNNRGSIWEGDFKNGGSATGLLAGTGSIHQFPSGRLYNRTSKSSTINLSWSDPGFLSDNDYDLFVLNSSGSTIVDISASAQNGTQDPYEIAVANTGERVIVVQFTGQDRALRLFGSDDSGVFSESTTGEMAGHASATLAFGVAAIDATQVYPNTFSSAVGFLGTESFSSRGDRRVFYDAAGNPYTPGNYLFGTNGGILRGGPTFAAADGVTTTVPGFAPFYGTSAAAPHAAAMWAQLRSLSYFNVAPTQTSYVDAPNLTPIELTTVWGATAIDADAPGFESTSGIGALMVGPATSSLVNFIGGLSVTVPTASDVSFAWSTVLPADAQIEISTGPKDPNPIILSDSKLDTIHLFSVSGLSPATVYQYKVSSGSASGAVYGERSGTFKTEFVLPTQATLLNKTASIWQLQVTLTNTATVDAKNIVIDGVVLNAGNTITKLPIVVPVISAGTSYTSIYKYNKMKLLGVLNVRVTGSYTTPTGATARFSKILPVQIL